MNAKVNARDFLEQVQKIDAMIENKTAEKERWVQIAQGLGGSGADSDKVKSSGKPDKMAEAVARYIDIEKEIDECIDRLYAVKKDVLSVIEMLNVIEYKFLYKHYFDFKDIGKVAFEMDRSYSWGTTTHQRALANVQKILDERTGLVARYEKVVKTE